jgi:hypothetical protein
LLPIDRSEPPQRVTGPAECDIPVRARCRRPARSCRRSRPLPLPWTLLAYLLACLVAMVSFSKSAPRLSLCLYHHNQHPRDWRRSPPGTRPCRGEFSYLTISSSSGLGSFLWKQPSGGIVVSNGNARHLDGQQGLDHVPLSGEGSGYQVGRDQELVIPGTWIITASPAPHSRLGVAGIKVLTD